MTIFRLTHYEQHFGVGVIPWSPLAGGLLARPLAEKTIRGNTDPFINRNIHEAGTEEIIKRYVFPSF
jgi:aryl-alcohol dehydrogenase-like predicted oxidoreductase